jgi:1-acyl-sn-glycerol-3-phosphate acyltransferase
MKNVESLTRNGEIVSSSDKIPAITAHKQEFWIKIFDFAFTRMITKSFYSMRVKNLENFNLRNPNRGNILIANHCCWWDGPMGFILSRKALYTKVYMMIEELYRFPLLSKIGAFSVEKNSPQSAIKALNYSSQILENPENSLWIFPQGFVMPPDYRPVKLASGVSYLCKKVKGVNLIPIAHRYNFIREDRPEIFVEIGRPIIINDNSFDRKEFTNYLEQEFTTLLDGQKQDVSSGNFEAYEHVFKTQLCLAKKIEQHFKSIIQSLN